MFYDCFMQPLTPLWSFNSSRQRFGCGWMLSSVMEGSDHSIHEGTFRIFFFFFSAGNFYFLSFIYFENMIERIKS